MSAETLEYWKNAHSKEVFNNFLTPFFPFKRSTYLFDSHIPTREQMRSNPRKYHTRITHHTSRFKLNNVWSVSWTLFLVQREEANSSFSLKRKRMVQRASVIEHEIGTIVWHGPELRKRSSKTSVKTIEYKKKELTKTHLCLPDCRRGHKDMDTLIWSTTLPINFQNALEQLAWFETTLP